MHALHRTRPAGFGLSSSRPGYRYLPRGTHPGRRCHPLVSPAPETVKGSPAVLSAAAAVGDLAVQNFGLGGQTAALVEPTASHPSLTECAVAGRRPERQAHPGHAQITTTSRAPATERVPWLATRSSAS